MRQLNCTVTLKDGSRPSFKGLEPLKDYLWACKQDTPVGAPNQDCSVWLDNDNPGRFYITLPDNAAANPAYNWKIGIKNLGTISFRSNLFPVGTHENGTPTYYTDPKELVLEPSVNFFKPTRDQACRIQVTLQGLIVNTVQFGNLPWFEPAYNALDDLDRESVLLQKLAAGDKHCIIWAELEEPSVVYNEPGNPYYSMMVQPYDTPERCVEILSAGLIPVLVLDGDGRDGWQVASDQLSRVSERLKDNQYGIDLSEYVVFMTNWDGVFYGWEPSEVVFKQFGDLFRSLIPNGFLALEFNTGHIPIGGGPSNYGPNAALAGYDIILWEGNDSNIHDDNTWQVLQRLLGPNYIKPPDDPNSPGPWYPAAGTNRGPYYVCAFEWKVYEWVRSRATVEEIQIERNYLKALSNSPQYSVA